MKPLARLRRSWRAEHERWLLSAAALALVGALLAPSVPLERQRHAHVVVLDVTQSMNVQDHLIDGKPVSRLAWAKHALREALLQLPCGSRVGWALFTEYRSFLLFTPVEVCANLQELRSTLERIDGRMAWTGNSEVAKGLFSGIGIARQLPGTPSLVFVTDGHEAPPLHPNHRPAFNAEPGEVAGWIVGVGGLAPQPIPKIDPLGRPLGHWRADEVMQTDPRSRGRAGSISGEHMTEDSAAAPLPGAVVGSEHLSSLREAYLRLLASETGLRYQRLQEPAALVAALRDPALARPVPATLDLAAPLSTLALSLLLVRHWQARRGRAARRGSAPG